MQKGPYLTAYGFRDEERISGIDFGSVFQGQSSADIFIWVWNRKDYPDSPDATEVRICAIPTNDAGLAIIQNRLLKVRSSGVKDPDMKGIIDDHEMNYSEIGESLLDENSFHRIGDIPSNCARRIYFSIVLPSIPIEINGYPSFVLNIGYFAGESKWLYAEES